MFYSKLTKGFYSVEIHGTKIPPDAVEITDAQWRALLVQQEQGKVIVADALGKPVAQDPAPVLPSVPKTVSAFQAKAALYGAGLLTSVQAAMATAPAITQLAWAEATEFQRDSPAIASVAAQLNWSAAQLDALYVTASGIKA